MTGAVSGQPIGIAGNWKGDATDIPGVVDNMREPYSYDMNIKIKQKGTRLTMDGTYNIIGHPEDPTALHKWQCNA